MKIRFIFFLLLLFSISIYGQYIPINQNPKYSSAINPKYNSKINPTYTSGIHPKYNSRINPKYTSSLNPAYSSKINPKYSSSLNPKYNSKINPKYNTNLDPSYSSWKGKYMFNESAEPIGILVYANSDTYLFYDMKNEWVGYFIRANTNYNLFNLDGEWTMKYLCSDSENGYNLFDANGDWTGDFVK